MNFRTGNYLWMNGLANERCAQLCRTHGFEAMEIFFAEQAVKHYDAWGSKALTLKVIKTHIRRTDYIDRQRFLEKSASVASLGQSSVNIALTPMNLHGSASASSPSIGHLSSSSTSRTNLFDSESSHSSAHIQYARTIARGLVNHYTKYGSNSPPFFFPPPLELDLT